MLSRIILLAMFAFSVAMSPALALDAAPVNDANIQTIRTILEKPDDKIDLARAKLTLDRMIDPSINIESNAKRIDAMVADIRLMLPEHPSSLQKMETLIQYLYKPGTWNGNHAFSYDLNDPFGGNIQNKLLPTYLTTRKGNCLSMPVLFIILGQKVGLEVTASTTPQHVFVKYQLDGDIFRNFEATSGGPKLDSTYRRDMPMTDQALANGLYMQPLSKRETVVVMAEVLLQFYRQQDQQEKIIALCDLLLEYAPKNVASMLFKGSAYGAIARRDFNSKYRELSDVPQQERARFFELSRNNQLWFHKAEMLGWREPDAASRANYIQTVERVKTAQQQ